MGTADSLVLVVDDVLDPHFAFLHLCGFLGCHVGFRSDVVGLGNEFPLLGSFSFVLGMGSRRKLIEG